MPKRVWDNYWGKVGGVKIGVFGGWGRGGLKRAILGGGEGGRGQCLAGANSPQIMYCLVGGTPPEGVPACFGWVGVGVGGVDLNSRDGIAGIGSGIMITLDIL